MLPRANRLRLQKDIANVKRRGKVARGDFFTIRFFLRNCENQPRFTVVVSKKVSAKATERNKVTRWVRAVLEDFLPRLVPCDAIIVAQRQFPIYSFVGSKRDIESLLEREKLLK